VRAHGLPLPVPQFVVVAPDGRLLRIDFAHPDRLLGIELLGAEFHAGPEQWRADTERLGLLAALGWHMLSFTYDQVMQQSATVVQAIERALSR
jgi:very-short-patch-repair endonuclease